MEAISPRKLAPRASNTYLGSPHKSNRDSPRRETAPPKCPSPKPGADGTFRCLGTWLLRRPGTSGTVPQRSTMSAVTVLLHRAQPGDPKAAAELLPLVYDELRRVAAARMAAGSPGLTLQPTALVHEAWLRLVSDAGKAQFQGRTHFFAAAAEAMRHILIDRARRKQAARHGGGQQRGEVEDLKVAAPADADELLAVNAALERLALADPAKAELVNPASTGSASPASRPRQHRPAAKPRQRKPPCSIANFKLPTPNFHAHLPTPRWRCHPPRRQSACRCPRERLRGSGRRDQARPRIHHALWRASRIQPRPGLVRISANSETEILNRPSL